MPKVFRKHDYRVRPCPLAAAQEMVRREHYARGSSNTAVYSHGLYFGENLVGCALWLPPTRVAAESVNRENWQRVLSLSRLVVLPEVPTNGESFLIGRSIRLIRSEQKWLSLVTYADESQGHTGAIYKATNWEFIGRTGPYPRWVDASGRQVACKATKNRTKQQMLDLGHLQDGRYHKLKFVIHLKE